jgi:hypothetical protein
MEPIFYVYVRIGWYEARKSIPQKERGDGTITAVTMCVVWQTKLCIKDYEIKFYAQRVWYNGEAFQREQIKLEMQAKL